MHLETGNVISGFRVNRIRESKELGGRLIEMKHIGCGAELIFMENGDSNKLFSVGFKTLPEDHTGVFHILEHSVLCGSEKYPVKEPFVDLLKSSMNTFLNAMTFQDKTVYPVSSRNDKDFLNLTSVYLDAVFAPRCVIDPNAFRQEGWHLEVDENGKPFFNGVVYNEMKGATSGIDDILAEGMGALLFPDNCCGFNSGGDPEFIPELTYEQYKGMYRKYYHPSNARFFLDGDVPLESTLELINSYIGKAEAQPAEHPIPMQKSVVNSKTLYYEIGAEEESKNRTMLSFGRIISTFEEKRRTMMADILCSLLADTNESPLKRALLDAGLAEDVELYVYDGMQQERLVMNVRNTEKENEASIRDMAKRVINDLLEKGLDRDMLTAYLNKAAFRLKDMHEPAGLMRCIESMMSTLYGGDPMLYLENDEDIKALRQGIENGDFDSLLRELFDFDSMSVLTVLPSASHGEKLRAEEARRAQAMFDSLSDDEKAELSKANDRLHEWQTKPDSEEAVKKLPTLDLSEVSPDPVETPTEIIEKDGVKLMYHAISTNGIAHFSMYFAASDLKADELPQAGLMTMLYTALPTKKHSVPELQQLINTYIGSLKFELRASMKTPETCMPYIIANFSALEENTEKAFEIVSEMLLETDFSDRARIKENLLQIDQATKQNAIMSGHTLGMGVVSSRYLSSAVVQDAASGIAFRSFIKSMLAADEARYDQLTETLRTIAERTVCASRLTIGVTDAKLPEVGGFISKLPKGEAAGEEVHYDSVHPEKLGVRIPAQVSFAEKGMYTGYCSGSMKVAENIISLNHLWSRVRVQGGAYGCGMRFTDTGMMAHYSYRDPSPARTIGVYGEEADFVTGFCAGGEKLDKYIISTIGNSEPLRSPKQAGSAADMDILNGRTREEAKLRRREMLETSPEDLLALRDLLKKCSDEGAVCIVGSEKALAEFDGMTVIDI